VSVVPGRDWSGVITAALLALASLASAWCTYQAGLWGGEQTRSLAEAAAKDFEALQKSSEAQVLQLVDISTFSSYVQTSASGERKVAEYFREHARPGFQPALDSWIAERAGGREPPDLPFKSPLYRLEPADQAVKLNGQAKVARTASDEANENGDHFVLQTVMFAMALFFLGTSSSSRHRTVQKVMLVLGAVILLFSAISMLRLPRVSAAPHASDLRR
jgi:hypothetical protein